MVHKVRKYQTRLGAYYSQHKKLKKIVKSLKETIDWIENYIEDRTGVEFGKNLLDSDSDSNSDSDHIPIQRVRYAEPARAELREKRD